MAPSIRAVIPMSDEEARVRRAVRLIESRQADLNLETSGEPLPPRRELRRR